MLKEMRGSKFHHVVFSLKIAYLTRIM